MLYYLRDSGKNRDRKVRLFAVACCRRVWHLLKDERSREAVEVSERYADGQASAEDLERADLDAMSALDEICTARNYDIRELLRKAPLSFPRGAPAGIRWACSAAWTASEKAERAAWTAEGIANTNELAANSDLLRCIFSNPFHPQPRLDPSISSWNDGTVSKLAQAIYSDSAFDRLPVLADALEDAGCANESILFHLRHPGPHTRGCWAVDLILGKQ
jgi:hypothetical protein